MTTPFWQAMALAPRPDHWVDASRRHRPRLAIVAMAGRDDVSHAVQVDVVDLAGAEAVRHEWQMLLGRALEPNIFMEPAFALAAARHFAEAQRPLFALVRDAGSGTLLAIWPIEPRRPAFQRGFVRSWLSQHAVLGAPLIDRGRATDVADAVLDAVANRFGANSLLLVPQLLRAGPTYGLLVSRALAMGRAFSGLSPHARAVLRSGDAADALFRRASSPKHLKDFARKRARLQERGAVAYHSATTADDVREAIERFLVLEGSGWKGERGTALLSGSGSTTFTRAMLRTFADKAQCRIDSLTVGGRTVAMAIILTGQGHSYYWKTTYDEAFRAFSPGALLSIDVTRRQLDDAAVLSTDSCAIAGHPMIERLWPDRQDVVDLAIAASARAVGTQHALQRERVRRQLREWAKRSVQSLRLHLPSPWRRLSRKPETAISKA